MGLGRFLYLHELYVKFIIITYIISGSGMTLQHIRYNSECDVYEELEPIERNLRYDFNFQQINHLPREIIIKPVS